MDTYPRYPGGTHSAGPRTPDPDTETPDTEDWPDDVDDPVEPDPTWKHPDDGKELPERDREFPLKP